MHCKKGGLTFTRRNVHCYETTSADPQQLRAWVREQPGGRNVLWPLLRATGLRCSRKQLLTVIDEIDAESVDYAPLDQLLEREQQDHHDEDLYALQKQCGLTFTKRQVHCYEGTSADPQQLRA